MIEFALYSYLFTSVIVAAVLIEALFKGYTNLLWYVIFVVTSPFCFIGFATSYISGKSKRRSNDTTTNS